MTQPEPINTGTGAARRRLTVEEAERGGRPEPFTAQEWQALHRASEQAAADGLRWAALQRDTRDDSDDINVPDWFAEGLRSSRLLGAALTRAEEP